MLVNKLSTISLIYDFPSALEQYFHISCFFFSINLCMWFSAHTAKEKSAEASMRSDWLWHINSSGSHNWLPREWLAAWWLHFL